MKDIEFLTFEETKEYVKELQEDNKNQKHIIEELEYRIEKLGIKSKIQIKNITHPKDIYKEQIIATYKTIPEFQYVEYEKIKY